MRKMTKKQVAETLKKLNMPDDVKKELQRQCDHGDPGARFYVYSKFIKFERS